MYIIYIGIRISALSFFVAGMVDDKFNKIFSLSHFLCAAIVRHMYMEAAKARVIYYSSLSLSRSRSLVVSENGNEGKDRISLVPVP